MDEKKTAICWAHFLAFIIILELSWESGIYNENIIYIWERIEMKMKKSIFTSKLVLGVF